MTISVAPVSETTPAASIRSAPSLPPGYAEALASVRTGPDAPSRLKFAVTHALYSGGVSPAAAVRGWYRRWWWADIRQRHGLVGALGYALKTPARIARESRRAVRAHGAACASAYGVSETAQFAQLLWLGISAGIDSDSYYRFWLFRPERRRVAREYLQTHEAALLYRLLTAREAVEDFLIIEDKRRFAEWSVQHGLPTAPVLAEIRDGEVRAVDGGDLVLPERDLFSKPTDRYGGVGVRRWHHVGAGRWADADGSVHDRAALLGSLQTQSRDGPVVLQPCLVNDAAVTPLAPRALCTLRVLTARPPGGKPEVVLATFRTGSGASDSDNFSAGGITASVDMRTGRLKGGVRLDERLVIAPVEAHPDTGERFEGFAVPSWEEAKALALAAHARLRSMAFVGWDVAFTPDGLVLIEGNFNPGVRIVQAGWGVPLGETPYLRYLDAHLRRSFARGHASRESRTTSPS